MNEQSSPGENPRKYNLKTLAMLYGKSTRTMRSWLKPHNELIGPCLGRSYTPRQLKIIFEKLGPPKEK